MTYVGKMKIQQIFWNKSIDDDFANTVLDKLNNLPDETQLVIYLNSTGGTVSVEKVLIDAINLHRDKVTLVAVGIICSAAFSLFFLTKCHRRIIHGLIGMYHTTTMELSINILGQPSDQYNKAWQRLLMNEDKEEAETMCDYLDFDPQQKERILQGKDVYFNTEEMQKFLEISNTKNNEDQFRKNTK